jgi:hypothetical protein
MARLLFLIGFAFCIVLLIEAAWPVDSIFTRQARRELLNGNK